MSESPIVHQLRVVVEADDYDAAVRFYRDVLGMPELAAFSEGGDDRVAILEAGRATLEIASPGHGSPSTGSRPAERAARGSGSRSRSTTPTGRPVASSRPVPCWSRSRS